MLAYRITLALIIAQVQCTTLGMSFFKRMLIRNGNTIFKNAKPEYTEQLQALETIPETIISYETRKKIERRLVKGRAITGALQPIFSINWNHYDVSPLEPTKINKHLDAAFEGHLPLKKFIVHLATHQRLDPRIALNTTTPVPHLRIISQANDKSCAMAQAIAQALKRKHHNIALTKSTSHPTLKMARNHIENKLIEGLITTQSCNPVVTIHTNIYDACILRSLVQYDKILTLHDPELGSARVPLHHCFLIESSDAHMLPDKHVYEYDADKYS